MATTNRPTSGHDQVHQRRRRPDRRQPAPRRARRSTEPWPVCRWSASHQARGLDQVGAGPGCGDRSRGLRSGPGRRPGDGAQAGGCGRRPATDDAGPAPPRATGSVAGGTDGPARGAGRGEARHRPDDHVGRPGAAVAPAGPAPGAGRPAALGGPHGAHHRRRAQGVEHRLQGGHPGRGWPGAATGSAHAQSPLAQLPQRSARAEQGLTEAAAGTAKSTVIGPPWRWRAWIGKLAAPTTRRKISASEYRSDSQGRVGAGRHGRVVPVGRHGPPAPGRASGAARRRRSARSCRSR